jgi:hypothetical protein
MAVFVLLACLSFFALIALVKIGSRPLDLIDLDIKRIPAHMCCPRGHLKRKARI